MPKQKTRESSYKKLLYNYYYRKHKFFLPRQLLVPIVAPSLGRNGNLRCLLHREFNSLCNRHLRFPFRPSLAATICTKSWHEGIAAIMKMAVCERCGKEYVRPTSNRRRTDRCYYLAISSHLELDHAPWATQD